MIDPQDPEKNKHVPPLQEVTDAYAEVAEHNEKYTSTGAAFRHIVNGLITDAVLANDEDSVIVKPSELPGDHPAVIEGDMDAELQEMFHGDTFARIGIKLYPIGGENIRSFNGRRAASTELEPTIVNTQLYLDFLRQQTKEGVNRHDENFKLMADVVKTLKKVINIAYTEGAKDFPGSELLIQHGEDALRTFIAIDEQYQRLGLDMPARYAEYLQAPQTGYLDEAWRNRQVAQEYQETYNEIQAYVHYWGEDVLAEYIAVGSPVELSKPKEWAADNTMSKLDELVETIAKLVGPERTTKFGLQSAKAALDGVEATLGIMDQDSGNWMNKMDGARAGFERNIKRLNALLGN